MISNKYILLTIGLGLISAVTAAAAPLKYKVTIAGTHDIDWTFHLKEDTSAGGGYRSDLSQEGTEFVDYDSVKPATMIFKKKPGVGLIGTTTGKGIDKYPKLKADITNTNITNYSCSGNCPAPPDQNTLKSGCGHSLDTANVKLAYQFGTFTIESLNIADLGAIPPGVNLPAGFNPSSYALPIGVLFPTNCGPSFPPNNPAQDLVDYRYPFLLISNSNILPGKPSVDVDKKLKKLKVGKSLVVRFENDVSPSKILLFDGSGYTYTGQTGVSWKLRVKRVS